jgi:hypothetical protein
MRERRPANEPDDLELICLFRQSRLAHGDYPAEMCARYPDMAERLRSRPKAPSAPSIPPWPWHGQLWNGVYYPADGSPPRPYKPSAPTS